MNLNQQLVKIDTEIPKELNVKAVDRLKKLIYQYPNNLKLRAHLAELYYESGFLETAGKFWMLSEPATGSIKRSIATYEQSVNFSATKILNDIVFRGDKNKLPEYAKKKLIALEKDSLDKSNYIPAFSPKKSRSERTNDIPSLSEKIMPFVLASTLVFIFVLLLITLGVIINWML